LKVDDNQFCKGDEKVLASVDKIIMASAFTTSTTIEWLPSNQATSRRTRLTGIIKHLYKSPQEKFRRAQEKFRKAPGLIMISML